MHAGGSGGAPTDRGQTGLDFLVGIGVFLLTVGFVLAFVPGTLTPFSDATEQPLVADRAADTVVAGLVAGPEPTVLNTTCTVAFFGVGNGTNCVFDTAQTTTADGLRAELGLPAFTRVNVTLERGVAGSTTRTGLWWDGTSGTIASSGDTRLATGPTPPAESSAVTAIRTVYVDGQDAVVVVRVW